jgi:hypothetical protein
MQNKSIKSVWNEVPTAGVSVRGATSNSKVPDGGPTERDCGRLV